MPTFGKLMIFLPMLRVIARFGALLRMLAYHSAICKLTFTRVSGLVIGVSTFCSSIFYVDEED